MARPSRCKNRLRCVKPLSHPVRSYGLIAKPEGNVGQPLRLVWIDAQNATAPGVIHPIVRNPQSQHAAAIVPLRPVPPPSPGIAFSRVYSTSVEGNAVRPWLRRARPRPRNQSPSVPSIIPPSAYGDPPAFQNWSLKKTESIRTKIICENFHRGKGSDSIASVLPAVANCATTSCYPLKHRLFSRKSDDQHS
jgi:hypothetical protein